MIFTPRPYQKIVADFVFDHPRCNIWSGMGTGKTAASIAAFNSLRLFGEASRALVIAPKRVAVSTWPDEIDKWRESFGHLTIACAVGTPAQRLEALKRKADLTTINFENVEWLIETVGASWPWDMVICDEATRLKGLRITLQTSSRGKEFITGQGSVRAKALAAVAFKRVRRWVNLTGSPAPNGLQDTWGQQWFVDGGRRLGSSFGAFESRWFRSKPTTSGFSIIEPLEHAQAQIEAALKDCTVSVNARDWFDIKDVIEHHVEVELPPKARQAYDQMESELFAEIDQHEIEVFNAGSKANKCLQIGSGSVYTDPETRHWVAIHDEKIEALKSIVSETNGEILLVSYQFRSELERILKMFPQARTLGNDTKNLELFRKGRIPMLVGHAASMGHGLSLQDNCRILVDFSSGWNLELDEQILERIGPTRQAQSGYNREVYRYRIVSKDTIESDSVIPRLKSKATVQEALKAAMKKRKTA